jgi:hypothetical protein
MKSRNYALEIIEKKKHLKFSSDGFERIYERLYDVSLLENFYEEVLIRDCFDNEDVSSELEIYNSAFIEGIKYIPVSLVACIESFFRFLFARTIDADLFYKDNASKFDIKYNLKTAIDLEVNKLSIGEFISHLLRVNNIADIGFNMSQILGEDYFFNFKKWRKELESQVELFPLSDSEKESHLFDKLNRLFELRHRICHEAYTPVSIDDIRDLISFTPHVREFISVTEKYVEEHIKTNKALQRTSR